MRLNLINSNTFPKFLFFVFVLIGVSGFAQSENHIFTILHSKTVSDTLKIPVADLQSYILRTIPTSKTSLASSDSKAKLEGNVIVLVEKSDPAIALLCKQYNVAGSPAEWNSFRISSFVRKDDTSSNIYFLEGADSWGKQYAVYDFAERFLGVKYLKPEIDHINVQHHFSAKLINTGIQKTDYKWRGLYPWHYNYNSRGLSTFCDINAHYANNNWAWYLKLADWMVKNKQNAVLWFDDVFGYINLSAQFPDSVRNHFALRGIKQVMGLGWASNEGRPRGGQWESKYICLDKNGKSVEDAHWKSAICPQTDAYFKLADINFNGLKIQKDNYLGTLIGYGENTWASNESGNHCVLHANTESSSMMVRDLKYITQKFKDAGLSDMPLGYVISTYSQMFNDSPFETDTLINNMPKNGIFTMHTYQQDSWKSFKPVYDKIEKRNNLENTNIKVFHIGEVSFICNHEIPLLRPSILRRREAHFRTLPRENTIGHLVTLNTTQYLYWYKSYQMMQWQWHQDDKNWFDVNVGHFTDLFGTSNGKKLGDLLGRLTCLEYLEPYSALDSLIKNTPEVESIPEWERYDSPSTHTDDFGFLLWAKEKDIKKLDDTEKSITAILNTNEELLNMPDTLYRLQFYPTIRLTANYFAIRVFVGKYNYYLNNAQTIFKVKGWNNDVENQLNHAKAELNKANASLAEYNRLFLPLLGLKEPLSWANIDDIKRDFVINPNHDFMNKKLVAIEDCIKNKVVNISIN